MLPVDVTASDWPCTIGSPHHLRMGLRYVRGLRQEAGQAIVRERARAPFSGIGDLVRRVPELRKDELNTLAGVGALNRLEALDRRGSLWESACAIQQVGPLLAGLDEATRSDFPHGLLDEGERSPLKPMTPDERLRADYHGTGMTVGRHPMAYRREEMNARGVTRASICAGCGTERRCA